MYIEESMYCVHVQVEEVFLSGSRRFDKRRLLLVCVCLLSCSFLSCSADKVGSRTVVGTVQVKQVALAQLHWCGKPSQLFRDEGVGVLATPSSTMPEPSPAIRKTPVTLQDWAQAKSRLNFFLYLPATLPIGTCLVSAYGTVHDPIFGGSFTITYLLPDHSSLSLSEAPLRSPSANLQCSAIPSGSSGEKESIEGVSTPPISQSMQLCSGAKNETSIVFSAEWSSELLHKFFQELQEKDEWLPLV